MCPLTCLWSKAFRSSPATDVPSPTPIPTLVPSTVPEPVDSSQRIEPTPVRTRPTWAAAYEVRATDRIKSTALAASGTNMCAVRVDGTLQCWGYSHSGQSNVPAGQFGEIAPGQYHNCGLRTDGTIQCWGRYLEGQTRLQENSVEFPLARTTPAGWQLMGLSNVGETTSSVSWMPRLASSGLWTQAGDIPVVWVPTVLSNAGAKRDQAVIWMPQLASSARLPQAYGIHVGWASMAWSDAGEPIITERLMRRPNSSAP